MKPINEPRDLKLKGKQRVLLLILSALVLLLLIKIGSLTPDPRGFGTHEQLGLTPCFFHSQTGMLCPTCGTTTAWTLVLHGNWTAAVAANLGGTLLCGVVVAALPWLIISAVRGSWLLGKPSLNQLLIVGSVWLAIMILDWALRLAQN